MRTWLLEAGLSILLFLVLIPLLITPLIAWVYRRYRFLALAPTVLAAVTALYASALFAFTTFPLPDAPESFCTQRREFDYWRLTPGQSFGELLDVLGKQGLVSTLTGNTFLQLAFNVVFFVPLGFLIAYWWRRGLGVALGLGLGTSMLIEVTQGSALWGLYPCPYRVAEFDDLITNTSGAVLGWGIGMLLTRLLPYRDPQRRSDVARPTVRRRLFAASLDVTVIVVSVLVVEVVFLLLTASQGRDAPAGDGWMRIVSWAVGAVVVMLVPLLRSDRATVGQSAVLLAEVRTVDGRIAGPGQVLIRFVVRWAPILMFGTTAIIIVLIVDGATVALRSDRSSLTGLLARSRTTTHDQVADSPQPG